MPRRYARRRRKSFRRRRPLRRRRRYRRRRYRSGPRSSASSRVFNRYSARMRTRRMPMVLPDKLRVTFKTCWFNGFLAGTIQDQTIMINSVNNPAQFSAGSEKQPQYWSVYKAMGYQQYYVRSTTVYLRFINDIDTNADCWLGVVITRGETPPAYSTQTAREDLNEDPKTWTWTFNQQLSPKPITRKFKAVTKRFWPYDDPRNLGATMTTDPVQKLWLHIMADLGATSGGGMRIEYAVYQDTILWKDLLSPVD